MISISFDDGWKNQYTRALPILDKYNFKATFYVITKMPQYMLKEGEGRMSIDEWKILKNKGHEIGGHSQTHPRLQISLPPKVKREIIDGRNDLIELGFESTSFAYPYGRKNWYVTRVLRRSGYSVGRLADGGVVQKNSDIYLLPAFCIMADHSLDYIKKLIDENEKNNTWLILVFHQIENNPSPWGCTPEFFEKLCEYIYQEKHKVVSVSEGAEIFKRNSIN